MRCLVIVHEAVELVFFFFQAEDGIRDVAVTGVQTCALPILKEARAMARRAAEAGDDGTNDLLVSDVIRTNEMQAWFLGEHLVEAPAPRERPTRPLRSDMLGALAATSYRRALDRERAQTSCLSWS